MASAPELLQQDGPRRAWTVWAGAAAVLLVVVAGASVVRGSPPPEPLAVEVTELDGSALVGESFVRLQVQLRSSGARELGTAQLTVAGATGRGLHDPSFGDDGLLTVQVDLTPDCPTVARGVLPGTLDLRLDDDAGERRLVQLAVPTAGRLERLVRYRCRTA